MAGREGSLMTVILYALDRHSCDVFIVSRLKAEVPEEETLQ